MWGIWRMFPPRRTMILLGIFLAALAFTIHFILLSTERYNWLMGSLAEPGTVGDQLAFVARSALTLVS